MKLAESRSDRSHAHGRRQPHRPRSPAQPSSEIPDAAGRSRACHLRACAGGDSCASIGRGLSKRRGLAWRTRTCDNDHSVSAAMRGESPLGLASHATSAEGPAPRLPLHLCARARQVRFPSGGPAGLGDLRRSFRSPDKSNGPHMPRPEFDMGPVANRSALLAHWAVGDTFHLAAARILDPTFEGSVIGFSGDAPAVKKLSGRLELLSHSTSSEPRASDNSIRIFVFPGPLKVDRSIRTREEWMSKWWKDKSGIDLSEFPQVELGSPAAFPNGCTLGDVFEPQATPRNATYRIAQEFTGDRNGATSKIRDIWLDGLDEERKEKSEKLGQGESQGSQN